MDLESYRGPGSTGALGAGGLPSGVAAGRQPPPSELPLASSVPSGVASDVASDPALPELVAIFRPIEEEMASLNEFLAAEFSSTEPFIHELLLHIARYAGKQLRPACLFLAARAAHGEIGPDHVKCAGIIELIHTATLVHDDVLDEAKMRRKMKTVNERWGERAAVLLGDFIYSRGFTLSTEVAGVSGLLAAVTHEICEGELLQVGSAFDVSLSEERYFEIIFKKTAVLYGLACRLGAMLSGASEETQGILEEFGRRVGLAFQITDDVLDLIGDEYVVGKSLGTDLAKGKLTLPLIRLRHALAGGRLEEYLWLLKTPHAQGAHLRVLRMLRDTEVLATVRASAAQLIAEGSALLDRLSDVPVQHPVRRSLESLAMFIVGRQH